jgi:hypothetical protein
MQSSQVAAHLSTDAESSSPRGEGAPLPMVQQTIHRLREMRHLTPSTTLSVSQDYLLACSIINNNTNNNSNNNNNKQQQQNSNHNNNDASQMNQRNNS